MKSSPDTNNITITPPGIVAIGQTLFCSKSALDTRPQAQGGLFTVRLSTYHALDPKQM